MATLPEASNIYPEWRKITGCEITEHARRARQRAFHVRGDIIRRRLSRVGCTQ